MAFIRPFAVVHCATLRAAFNVVIHMFFVLASDARRSGFQPLEKLPIPHSQALEGRLSHTEALKTQSFLDRIYKIYKIEKNPVNPVNPV